MAPPWMFLSSHLRRRARVGVLAVGVVVLGSACSVLPGLPSPSPSPSSTPTVTLAPVEPVDAGLLGLVLAPDPGFTGRVDVVVDADGSTHLVVTGDLQATLTSDSTLDPLSDGSLLVTDADGTILGGVAGGWISSDQGAVVVQVGDGDDLWIATAAVDGLDWGDREGGTSLAVTPTAFGRSGSRAAEEMIWDQVSADPAADLQTMRDQLDCHLLGAPGKATWNLEPWRPEVDAITMLSSRCNPE